MANLTQKEQDVLKAIDNNEYGDGLFDPVWSWSLEYNVPEGSEVTKKNIAGVVGSLAKKGFVFACTEDNPDDSCVEITEAGFEALKEAIGAENIDKHIKYEDGVIYYADGIRK